MNVRVLGMGSAFAIAALAVACVAERRSAFDEDRNATLGGDGGTFGNGQVGPGANCDINNTSTETEKDFDGDGFTLKDDCNECNTSINKGAYDVPGNGIDEDCTGVPDDDAVDCDANINLATTDPFEGAKALGLCKRANAGSNEWGVIEATWVKPDGSLFNGDPRSVGVLPKFGANTPKAGSAMLGLSSGFARAPGDPGFATGDSQMKMYSSGTPAGYPKASPACPGVPSGQAMDGVGLQLKIRVPTNAKSFTYQQFFFTHEFPRFICQQYNDFFVAMLDPIPAGLPDGNIAFDQDKNPISVNNSLLQVCAAGTQGGKEFRCPLGTGPLKGTGFESNGGTGWLTTAAPVKAGSVVTLRFAIWDSFDPSFDSTVLLDDFRFSIDGADTAQTKPSDPK